jgi:ATP-dependent Lon protease
VARKTQTKETNEETRLVGLLNDVVLPGEERTIAPPAVDAAALAALAPAAPKRVCVVAITSPAEVPAEVVARWGTECDVASVTPGEIVVRGVRRARVVAVRGASAPYAVDLERADDALEKEAARVVAGAHAVFAALEATGGALAGDAPSLGPGVAALLRAFVPRGEHAELLRLPPAEALDKVARSLGARAEAHRASCTLEQEIRALAAKPQIDDADRRRLWSEVTAILRRLDVFDPATLDEPRADIARLQQRLQQGGLPRDAREVAKRELRLLRTMKSDHHDYATYTAHLDFMARLAWHPEPLPPPDLDTVAATLEREHAGLDRAKRRILEAIAVRALGGSARGAVVCFVGPPGVGKTSVARSIASALGRKFVRVALGGVHDESEIRGHRLSFVAASPGRILGGMARVGSATPVVLLDEIDKIGTDRARSPAGALLEALDPEQNGAFYDNYLGVPYDLSHAMFLCTANELGDVGDALRDRLEAIEIDGYSVREKVAIARSHLLPRLREETGLPRPLAMSDETIGAIVEAYTREAGVRQLKRALEGVHRARALATARVKPGGDLPADECDAREVERALGPPRYARTAMPGELPVGVALGLAVGAEGGSVLFVEVAPMPGKGELRMTGRLGEVMREAGHAAIALLRSDPARYGVDPARLERDFHVHVPEAATPKEGPSAGIALFCALLSAATGRAARADVAMTGELTLRGRVLAVGGVRAKVLAAERAGVKRVLVPSDNRADVPEDLSIEVVLVSDLEDVVDAVFERDEREEEASDGRDDRSVGRAG